MTDTDGSALDGAAETVYIQLPAHPRFLRVARVVAAALANETGADIDALDDVRLAVGEACSLAVAAGAETIGLRFDVADERLVVGGDAPAPAVALDDDDVRFARQILAVATSSYALECEPDRISFTLEFDRGL